MKINFTYHNDEYEATFDGKFKVGFFLACFIKFKDLHIPIMYEHGGNVALQIWSTSYNLDINKSFEEQFKFINDMMCIGISDSIYIDIEEFNKQILDFYSSIDGQEIEFFKLNNKYSNFRNELRKGPDHYIFKIKSKKVEHLISDSYKINNYAELIFEFDFNGLFTQEIFNSTYFLDESCEEEPWTCINEIAGKTFSEDSCDFFVTYLCAKGLKSGIKEFSTNKNNKSNLEQSEIYELFRLNDGDSNYSVKLLHQGFEVETYFECMSNSLEKRIALFNSLLKMIGRKDMWFILSNGSGMLLTLEEYNVLMESNLLPPDNNYYNPWAY